MRRRNGNQHQSNHLPLLGVAFLAAAALTGCAGAPSTLDTAGPAAARIAQVWWVLLALASIATLIVVALLSVALFKRPADGPDTPEAAHRSNRLVIGGGIVLPSLMLPPVLLLTFLTMAALPEWGTASDAEQHEENLTVRITGHQFWWEVEYPEQGIHTANEVRVPVGRPVRFEVTASDVIHSVWVPQLHGKIDALPDRWTYIVLEAGQPGRFRGICAEFCGIQHAHMHFHVVAMAEEEFDAWAARQVQPAADPVEPLAQRGMEIFMASCAGCHAVAGTLAVARDAPNLSHLMSREWIAAGMLPNNTENLTAFVEDPGGIKPGNLMPAVALSPDDLRAVIAYLETLE